MKGKGFGANLKGGGSDVLTRRTHHVMIDGSDLTGQPYSLSKPFASIQYVLDNHYQEGDLIEVWAGAYTLSSALILQNFDEIHINFQPNASLTANLDQPMIQAVTNLKLYVYGRGEFRNDSPNLASNQGAVFAGGNPDILGARSISAQSGTLFGTTGGFQLLQNVDEMFVDTDAPVITVSTNEHDEVYNGIIRNCKKIGDITKLGTAISATVTANDSLIIENCNFYTLGANNRYAGVFAQSTNGGTRVIDCSFFTENFRTVIGSAKTEFSNCHFQNNSNLETVISTGGRPQFENCTFANYGVGAAVRVLNDMEFEGVNKMYTAGGANAIIGFDDHICLVNGTVYANVMQDQAPPFNTWFFVVNEPAPTVGEIYSITSPDGLETISYTVQAGDTRTEVINGIEAAYFAYIAANDTSIFAAYGNTQKLLGPTVWRFGITPFDANDNVNPNNPFVFDTNGTDSTTTILSAANGFSFKGFGKFMVDEDMNIPNLK